MPEVASEANIANAFFTGISATVKRLDFLVSPRPWRLFEIADHWLFPPFLRRCCQSTLTTQWTTRLPLLQSATPAALAADLILEVLEHVEIQAPFKLAVVDFCSGAGGPTPTIERLVNAKRRSRGQEAVSFTLTDLHPHLDQWAVAASRSAYLSFVPDSVDAANPPASVVSAGAAEYRGEHGSPESTVFRLYCLSFHHFDDEMARRVVASTLKTADGFAILELQDRHVSSLLLMCIEPLLLWFVTALWFWRDALHLWFTYLVPVLPPVHGFDGIVSCLRTRTFDEVMDIVDGAMGKAQGKSDNAEVEGDVHDARRCAVRGDWIFEGGKAMHTFPLGYMNWVVGRKRRTSR